MRKITVAFPWPFTAEETREILSFAFQVSLVTYLGLYLIESIRPSFVTLFYSLDTFLWIAIVTGVLSSVWPAVVPEAKHQPPAQLGWKDWSWMLLLAAGTVTVVYYKTASIGWLVNVIAPLSGLIVLGLSLLVYFDRDDDPESSA